MIFKNNYLEKLRANEIFDLAKFIVTENFKHHTNDELPKEGFSEINSIYKEEKKFFNNSKIFMARDIEGHIDGAIRVLKWNYKDRLPIEKIFGINPLEITGTSPLKSIWHIGRFAIKKGCADVNLFKKLMVCAISPICQNENSVAFAECDSKLLRVLRFLGIKVTVIGESVNYLGSETIPVSMDYYGLIDFYRKNKHLVSNEELLSNGDYISKLPKSVVFNKQLNN